MPWPIPTAKSIAERMAGSAELAITTVRQTAGRAIDPLALSRAVRSARGMFAIIFRTVAMELRQVHDHVAWWGIQIFVDTAEDEFVLRHASIWGVERRPATAAVGTVLVEGVPGTLLASEIELATSDGIVIVTTAGATIGVGGSVSVPVIADAAYAESGNIEGGSRVATVLPYPAISRVTIEEPGLAGGAPIESMASLQQAVMQRIRQPPHGGAGFDYPEWLRAAFAVRAVKPVTDWIGRGSVGVIVIMKDGIFGRAPTDPELDAMLDYLGTPGSATGVRPVTAHVVMVPGEPTEIPLTVRLRPDTVATRAAVTEAWQRHVATIGDAGDSGNISPIGATIEPSRISEAISAAAGEYAHDLIEPSEPYTLDPDQYPLPAAPTFEDPA